MARRAALLGGCHRQDSNRERPGQGPGAVAAEGADATRRHYGDSVWPFAMEPAGRLDLAGPSLLAALTRDAANLGPSMQGTGRPGCLHEAALRAEIEAEAARCDASGSLTALG